MFLQKSHDSTHKVSITVSNVPFLKVKSLPFIKCQLQECVTKKPNKQPMPKPTDTHIPKALFRIYILYIYIHTQTYNMSSQMTTVSIYTSGPSPPGTSYKRIRQFYVSTIGLSSTNSHVLALQHFVR